MPTIAEQFKAAGRLEGRLEISRDSIIDVLNIRFSSVSPKIRSQLDQIEDLEKLKQLFKTAITIGSWKEFINKLEGL